MAVLNFPTSPALNATYTANGKSWLWDGTSWVSANTTNLKTINGNSLLGTGDITITGGAGGSSGFEQTFLLMGA